MKSVPSMKKIFRPSPKGIKVKMGIQNDGYPDFIFFPKDF